MPIRTRPDDSNKNVEGSRRNESPREQTAPYLQAVTMISTRIDGFANSA